MGVEVASTQRPTRAELQATASGVISEPYPACIAGSGVAPSTQNVFGTLLGLRAGDVVTGLVTRNNVAAAGTLPTTARFGLADATGKILVLSGNLNALANWGLGATGQPFTAPYTVTADGGYFGCFVVNGTWGSTQPTPLEVASTIGFTAFGSNAPVAFSWAGQTDLPAVNSSLTITASSRAYYLAAY